MARKCKRFLAILLTFCLLYSGCGSIGASASAVEPTIAPTAEPTEEPTVAPTAEPTEEPTVAPTAESTEEPTVAPTEEPTEEPTVAPTEESTEEPTIAPTEEPTEEPTVEPTEEPTEEPTVAPAETPALIVRTEEGTASLSIDAGDAEIRWQSADAGILAAQPENRAIWADIPGEDSSVLTPSDVYGAYYTLYAYRAVLTIGDEKFVTDVFCPDVDPDMDAPLTADALAAYFGMTTGELAEALEISEEDLFAMARTELLEIYLMYGLSQAATYAAPVSEPSATNRVLLYNQARVAGDGQDEWRLLPLAEDTLGQQPNAAAGRLGSGCGLYTYAHAIQYLTGEKRTAADGGALLKVLIDVCNTPYTKLYPYHNFLVNECGIPSASIPSSEAELLSFMKKGGAIISLIGRYGHSSGHYVLAVGAVQADFGDGMKTWVHMVDSTCGSTIDRMLYAGHTAYDFETLQPITSDAGRYRGGEYWISYSSYNRLFIKANAYYKGGSTPSLAKACPTVAYEKCTYEITREVTLRKDPFSSAAKGSTLTAGDKVISTQIVDNGSQYWLKLTTGEYIYSGYDNTGVQTGTQYLKYKSSSPGIAWADNNISGSTLKQGASCSIRGTLSSKNTIRLVKAEIYRDGKRVGNAATALPHTTSFKLSGSAVDSGIPFGSLSVGSYTLMITAEYYVNRMQSTASYTFAAPFSVTADGSKVASTLQFTGVTYPKTFVINTSRGWGLDGGVLSSNYPLVSIRSRIVDANGDALSDSGVIRITGTSYTLKTLDSRKAEDTGVKFSRITKAGSYRWILDAADASGKELTVSMPFTAVASGSTSTSDTSAAYIDTLSVSLSASTVKLNAGSTKTLTASVTPSNATDRTVTWTSSNTAVAKVSSAGKITAVSSGEATITCKTADGASAKCKVTVQGTALKITQQPQNVTEAKGETARTTVKATGDGLTYTWYYKNANAASFAKSSITTDTYSAEMNDIRAGRQIYCVVKDKYGNSVKSNTVTLYMGTPLKITQQPQNVTEARGETARTTVKATGDGLTYTWYYKNANAASFAKSSITTDTYSAEMNDIRAGRQIYCVVKDKYGSTVQTNTVTLNMVE